MVCGNVNDTRVASWKETTCRPSWETSRVRKSFRHLGASSGAANNSKLSAPSWTDPLSVGVGKREARGCSEICTSSVSCEKRIAGRLGVNSVGM